MPFTQLRYHIVIATKHRRRVITQEVEEELYPVLSEASEFAGGRLLVVGGIEDHVHLLVAVPPRIALSAFVRDLKSSSTKAINEVFPNLDFRWQVGFGAFTISAFEMDAVAAYVCNQKTHHRRGNLWSLLENLEI